MTVTSYTNCANSLKRRQQDTPKRQPPYISSLTRTNVINYYPLDAGQYPTLARPAAPLAACVQRHPCTKTNKIWLPRQCLLRDQKTNFRLIIHSHSSANPENLAKIGPVDFEIIGRQESLKNKKQKQNIWPAGLLSSAGRAE